MSWISPVLGPTGLVLSGCVLMTCLAGCVTMESPPARTLDAGTVTVGGSLSGVSPPQVNILTGVGLEDGSLLARASTQFYGFEASVPFEENFEVLEGSVSRRYLLSPSSEAKGSPGRPRAISVGLRGGAYVHPLPVRGRGFFLQDPYTPRDTYPGEASDARVSGKYNESLLWGE